MASTTRGSIKISTANGIGAALVDVLGGEGYAPDKWEESINICGIHAADIEDALENIEEDAGTGTERGSILLSTANAIGATLNKKFNTSRGFKPKEWASAASKLEPLPERTASGAIVNITDGADGVPLKNWLVTLPASLDGYTAANGTKNTGTGTPETQYTAQLGRTIYGGTADIVTGEGSETYDNTSLDDLNYNYLSNITRFNVAISGADSSGYKDNIVIPTGYTISHTLITNASNAPDMTMCMYNGSLYVKNLSCTSKAELQSALSGKTLTFPLATPTDFTFTPITPTPETAIGVNNFWADEGDTEVTYRKDLDIPDPEPEPGNLLGMNNGNNEENEEESEG